MKDNFSNNNDNRPSIKSNDPFIQNDGPFIQNTPKNSIEMENVREFTDPYGYKTYMYENNGQVYFYRSNEIDYDFQSKAVDLGLFAAGFVPGLEGPVLIGSAVKNIGEHGWQKGLFETGAGKLFGKFAPKNGISQTLEYAGDKVGGTLFDSVSNSFKKLFGRDNSQGKSTELLKGFVGKNVLNKDLSPSDNLFKVNVSENVDAAGRSTKIDGPVTGPDGQTTGQAVNIAEQKLSAENAYNHPEVNTDPTQRVLGKDGAEIANPANLEGAAGKTDLAAASDPSKINKFFKTPNGQAISKVLYSGIKLGVGFLTSYLTSRMDQLLFGKEGAKTVGKVREGYSYYGTARDIYTNWSTIIKSAKATWSAIKIGAQAAWKAVSSLVGQAVQWVGSAIQAVLSAVQFVAGVIASAVASAASAVVGAIAAAFAWILAFPW